MYTGEGGVDNFVNETHLNSTVACRVLALGWPLATISEVIPSYSHFIQGYETLRSLHMKLNLFFLKSSSIELGQKKKIYLITFTDMHIGLHQDHSGWPGQTPPDRGASFKHQVS